MFSPVETEIAVKLVFAALLGLLIGSEREMHHKPAGFRTHALVCMGACLFTITSQAFQVNPSLVAAGIVTGIGFLGAGMVYQVKDKIYGLTTAAELWVLASIGIAVGIGYYFGAMISTIIVLAILVPGKLLEKKALKK